MGAGESRVEMGSAISIPTKAFSSHRVPDDLAGERERDASVPTAHVTLFFPHYINNY